MSMNIQRGLIAGISTLGLMTGAAQADQVINDDLIVNQSLCVGNDCVNGEAFGFDTIRMKENNVRIGINDTSNSASFPQNDWQLTFNDSGNGGQNKFSVDDISAGRTPFTIEAGSPSHALYVDDGGRIGLRTATPVVEMHMVSGDSPTMRLEQDGSSGFTPQTWDMAGNETNFFVRDATNGSRIPFKIRPSAPTNSIYVDTDGDIGLGTASPDAGLHVTRGSLLVEEGDSGAPEAIVHVRRTGGGAGLDILKLQSDNSFEVLFQNDAPSAVVDVFKIAHTGSEFRILNQDTAGTTEFSLDADGNLSLLGNLTVNTGGTSASFPDYVFDPEYELMPLAQVEAFIQTNGHLPKVPSAEQVSQEGINVSALQITLLEKVEELTLYTLAQQKLIEELTSRQ
ncbi:hypothetical protein PH5382_03278 [Phaeobacter sp. CECT 5382]|uniref:hypothetical protein n=1 Tax=Phaeobacter sp. CECT 5382 TaxID=1712645 RepID=UPI0006DA1D29|nr:hypothetical protein [Phaeobacter sp. CECT 5382]CUH89332.1 hypothetical protein PH5382_03278 [Phaeobacter sp. CECT 5382]